MGDKTPEDIEYQSTVYKNIENLGVNVSGDGLTQTVSLASNTEILLTNYVAEFSNTSSPLYDRTHWCSNNSITVTFSSITSS